MKMVIAYIRHEAFEPIRADLLTKGFPSLSVTEVKGSGRQKGITEHYRGSSLTNYLRPKVKIECVVVRSRRAHGRRHHARARPHRRRRRRQGVRHATSRRPTACAPARRARRSCSCIRTPPRSSEPPAGRSGYAARQPAHPAAEESAHAGHLARSRHVHARGRRHARPRRPVPQRQPDGPVRAR